MPAGTPVGTMADAAGEAALAAPCPDSEPRSSLDGTKAVGLTIADTDREATVGTPLAGPLVAGDPEPTPGISQRAVVEVPAAAPLDAGGSSPASWDGVDDAGLETMAGMAAQVTQIRLSMEELQAELLQSHPLPPEGMPGQHASLACPGPSGDSGAAEGASADVEATVPTTPAPVERMTLEQAREVLLRGAAAATKRFQGGRGCEQAAAEDTAPPGRGYASRGDSGDTARSFLVPSAPLDAGHDGTGLPPARSSPRAELSVPAESDGSRELRRAARVLLRRTRG